MKKDNKTFLLQMDIDSLRRDNRVYRELIESQRERLADLERLCEWSSSRLTAQDRYYVEEQLAKNRKI